ncbi:MAG: hypothetical protein HWN67_01900 [Candidatus Helarchaeota archaeon]|nr:hypothetical protein [Candidatus Helarchaeota archaeon]
MSKTYKNVPLEKLQRSAGKFLGKRIDIICKKENFDFTNSQDILGLSPEALAELQFLRYFEIMTQKENNILIQWAKELVLTRGLNENLAGLGQITRTTALTHQDIPEPKLKKIKSKFKLEEIKSK